MVTIFSVISYRGGTGKSLIAFSLASILSRQERTLFVDADFLAPSLYMLLDKKPQFAWNDYLLRRCSASEVIMTLNDKNGFKLDIIITRPDDREILRYFQDGQMWSKFFSDQIVHFLNEHCNNYRYIFFDNQSGMFLSTLTHSFFSDYLLVIIFPDRSAVASTIEYLKVQSKPFFVIWNHVLSNEPQIHQKIAEWTSHLENLSTYRGTLGTFQFDERAALNRWIEGRLFLDEESQLMREVVNVASILRKKIG